MSKSARALRRARTRASKLKNAQIDLEFFLDTFQAILSISKICARVRARVRVSAFRTYASQIDRFFTWILFLINFQTF